MIAIAKICFIAVRFPSYLEKVIFAFYVVSSLKLPAAPVMSRMAISSINLVCKWRAMNLIRFKVLE
ncbi:MAG: hypothetical protein CVU57_08725 [Deltaproteobacteria bacterium HGW-Deltaproteobacteria-15]|nr:MAG: hypothetical protein CVU57_08725 [Deltaproteobacteria bacterium HGW-Deltaproteobacteria-15]